MLEFYKAKNPDIDLGFKWGEWGDWGSCEAGKKMRQRSKIAVDGSIPDEEETEIEEGCSEVLLMNY